MSKLKAVFYNSVSEILPEHWDSLGCCDNTYYSPEFLEAFELANKDIGFTYIIIFRGNEAIAFANTQLVSISIETITQNIKVSERTRRTINNLFCNSNLRILFCGNVFLSGEYGTFLKAGEDKHVLFKELAKGLKKLIKSTKKLNAIFVKDFRVDSLGITDSLKDYDYIPMQVEPNMIIALQPEWASFEDYKSELKSKYRVKANKADSKSKALEMKSFSDLEIEQHKEDLQQLYQNMILNANFNAQILNLDTYSHLKRAYGDDFMVQGYFLEGKLVGFLSAMLNGKNLDAHFIGIDYSLNKEHAIYPRILNDYVRLGIEHQAKQINLGRTASEIKSTLGAYPEELTCYIRHKRRIPNQIMKPFIKNIQIKSFKLHTPFKEKKEKVAKTV